MEITIRDEFIKLGQALKLAGVVEDGVQAKYEIQDGNVKVNGEVDQRRGRKVYAGDVITFEGQEITFADTGSNTFRTISPYRWLVLESITMQTFLPSRPICFTFSASFSNAVSKTIS